MSRRLLRSCRSSLHVLVVLVGASAQTKREDNQHQLQHNQAIIYRLSRQRRHSYEFSYCVCVCVCPQQCAVYSDASLVMQCYTKRPLLSATFCDSGRLRLHVLIVNLV